VKETAVCRRQTAAEKFLSCCRLQSAACKLIINSPFSIKISSGKDTGGRMSPVLSFFIFFSIFCFVFAEEVITQPKCGVSGIPSAGVKRR
jgi:hypothetical protein